MQKIISLWEVLGILFGDWDVHDTGKLALLIFRHTPFKVSIVSEGLNFGQIPIKMRQVLYIGMASKEHLIYEKNKQAMHYSLTLTQHWITVRLSSVKYTGQMSEQYYCLQIKISY